MISALTIIHTVVSVLLILLVLLQFGKGAEQGLLGGESGSSAILPSGGNLLTKVTTVLVILFLGLAITLAVLRSKQTGTTIFQDETPQARPFNQDEAQIPGTQNQEPATPTQTKK